MFRLRNYISRIAKYGTIPIPIHIMFRLRNYISRIAKYGTIPIVRHVSTSGTNSSPIRIGISSVFGKYLLATNTISSGVLMLIGDICQQEIEYRQHKLEKRYDYGRMLRMFIVGLGFGPIHHYYYVWLAKAYPAKSAKIITWKILLDQVVMSPVCIAVFFYGMGAMEMKPVQESNKELSEKFREVYTMDWIIWPPSQFINFYYIPVKYQVVYINAVTMFYNVFLSYIKHRELAEGHTKQIQLVDAK